ncbi:hypothetical protein DRO97_06290 [Archaeoglobales archaeon]|nr:MAG: hypothetical protein DRO97_06290 [Archaeoglobales archaeon]
MKLDMSKYKPFREMAKTCRTREIREKKVVWPKFYLESYFNGRFRARILRLADVDEVAEVWRAGYPEVYGSNYDFVLYPDEIIEKVALEEYWEKDRYEKKHCMVVAEEISSKKIVASSLLTKDDKNLEIEYSMITTHPDYRMQHIPMGIGLAIAEKIAESGAEYMTTFLETWHDITQKLCIRRGWKIAGIFPGRFTRWIRNNKEYRGCVVYMYRFINGEEYVTKPEEWSLADEVREAWECLERINKKIEEKAEGYDIEKMKKLIT